MNENKRRKIMLVCAICLIIVFVPVTSYAYKYYNYSNQLNNGNILLSKDDFDGAVKSYNNAAKFIKSKKSDIDEKVSITNRIKASKASYDEGNKLSSEKKYLKAVETFKKVIKEDTKRYSSAENKIRENKDLYISSNLNLAKEKAKNNELTEAISFLDNIIKIDPSNKEALGLKDEYKQIIKSNNEAAAKTKEENNKNAASQKQNSSSESVSNSGYPKVIQLSSGVNIIESKEQDTGHLNGVLISCRFVQTGPQPYGIYFMVVSGGTSTPIPYKATFHLKGKDEVFYGETSGEIRFLGPNLDYIPRGFQIKVDFEATYKGKVYRFSSSTISNI